jgi:hypothetical protein
MRTLRVALCGYAGCARYSPGSNLPPSCTL